MVVMWKRKISVGHCGQKLESLVLVSLHDFAFAWSLVVYAAQVQNAVDKDAVEFGFIVGRGKLLRVGEDCVQAYKQVARNCLIFSVIKSYDISEIIVLQILSVDIENIIV